MTWNLFSWRHSPPARGGKQMTGLRKPMFKRVIPVFEPLERRWPPTDFTQLALRSAAGFLDPFPSLDPATGPRRGGPRWAPLPGRGEASLPLG